MNKALRIAALLPIGPEYSGRLLEGAIERSLELDGVDLVDTGYLRDQDDPCELVASGFDGALVWLRQNDD